MQSPDNEALDNVQQQAAGGDRTLRETLEERSVISVAKAAQLEWRQAAMMDLRG